MRMPQGNGHHAAHSAHGLILRHELTQEATDNQQLEPMDKATQGVLEQPASNVVADADYSNGAQFEACERAGITADVQPNRGTRIYPATASVCGGCPLKPSCTQAERCHLMRHPREAAFEHMTQRLAEHPEMMGRRRVIVEHPFGKAISSSGCWETPAFSCAVEVAQAVQGL